MSPDPKPTTPSRRTRRLFLVLGGLVAALAIALGVRWAFQTRTFPPSPTVQIPVTWTTAREAPMHVVHVGGKHIACDKCHGDSSTVPTAAVCASCHEAEDKTAHKGAAGAETTCLSCHAFGMNAPATCNGCHDKDTRVGAAPALAHHATAGVACGSCHSVHGVKGPRAVAADCTQCHATTSAEHGRLVARPAEHPEPEVIADAAAAPFAADAAALAWVRTTGPAAGAPLPDDPHAAPNGQVCSTCHAPHTGKAEANARCATCHVEGKGPPRTPLVAPRGHDTASHAACTTCHAPHDARKADVRACEGCHADRHPALENPGHKACTSCHTPHAPAEAKASCSTCHAGKAVLASTKAPAHTDCTSCHDPHQPKASPAASCVRCHGQTRPTHPAAKTAHGEPAPCTGCHAPHPKPGGAVLASPAGLATTCTSCHTKLGNDHQAHEGKVACTDCHKPHQFELASLGAKACASCHAPKVAAVSARPGHAQCKGCLQDTHNPVPKPACASCHATEVATAPKGHAACTSCHDAHSGSRAGHEPCTSCHADKEHALHANATPAGCAGCHRPHGPNGPAAPPACATCHAPATRGGLHDKAGHQDCKTCHEPHGPPRSDRATCTTGCHQDKGAHQPDAKVCRGCHIFRK